MTKPIALAQRAVALLNSVPYDFLMLVPRIATFSVFFRSGLVKLADWNSTLLLFQNEYKVPVRRIWPPAWSWGFRAWCWWGCSPAWACWA